MRAGGDAGGEAVSWRTARCLRSDEQAALLNEVLEVGKACSQAGECRGGIDAAEVGREVRLLPGMGLFHRECR